MNSIFSNLFSSQTITPASFPTILLSLALALALVSPTYMVVSLTTLHIPL